MKIAIKNFLPALVLSMYFFFGTIICTAQTAHDSLTYYGHSFVKIKTAQGTVIYIDPYNVNAFIYNYMFLIVIYYFYMFSNNAGSFCEVIR